MAKLIQITIEYEVANSATLTSEKSRALDAARVFIASKPGDPVRIVGAKFTNTKRNIKENQ